MHNIIKSFFDKRFLQKLFLAFGFLLDVAPRGKTQARHELDALYKNMRKGHDKSNIARDFEAIGQDLNIAMVQYATSQTHQTPPNSRKNVQ